MRRSPWQAFLHHRVQVSRDTVLYLLGLTMLAYQGFVVAMPNSGVIMAGLALVGLPIFLRKNGV